jgi:hypothetical protein
MRRSFVVLLLASMAAIVTLALVSAGLSHAQTMRENATFMGSEHRMSQNNHADCAENMSNHMNVTKYMHGNVYGECEEMHDSMNMTEHMRSMR